MNVVFIADGNNTLGMGHIYQTTTIINDILGGDYGSVNINIITKSEPIVVEMLKATGCDVVFCKDDDEIVDVLIHINPGSIVIDKLDVSPELARNIKNKLNSKLLIFTNLTAANDVADVTLLADIGSNFQNIYRKDDVTGKVEIFGPRFWIMRSEFFSFNLLPRKNTNNIVNIMLMFGGADPSNLSSCVLKEILNMKEIYNISLVLGASFDGQKELDSILLGNRSKTTVTCFSNISNVAEMMSNNDLVIASPGLSLFESLVVGIPVIGVHQNDIQKEAYQEIMPTVDKVDIGKLPTLIKNKDFVYPDSEKVVKMEIGKGKYQIIKEILSPL